MNKANSTDDCLPKFFKVYLPHDSGDDLEIPISFNSCLPKSLPENVTVRSIYGSVWKMALRKCSSVGGFEKFVMVNGWKRILKDEDLKGGEFLTFEFDGSRLFNFCIYGRTTCKRLTSSVQTKEIEDGEDGRSSDDVIVLDDDDYENDDENNDDDDEDGDENDDDDDDGDNEEDYGGEDESSEDIITLDENDEIETYGDEDKAKEDIIILDDDDDDDEDDDNTKKGGVETERKQKGSSTHLRKN